LRQVLGEGSFGCVRLVVHKASNAAYALKAMHKGHLISTNQVGNTVNEKRIMKMCDHPFILKCSGTFNQPKHVQLLLGLCPGGELFNLMSRVGTLKADKTAMYVAMVASALGFLSARNIAHRDLKLENLLFDDKGYLKLVDFGFAKVVESRTWTFCGTPDYLAPEILSHAGHNFAVDWWTLGILTYEMLHGEPPFCEDDQMATFKRIAALDYTIKESVPEDAKKLIKGLLHATPSKRHGMRASAENGVLKHKFCAHVDVEKLLKKEMSDLPFVPLVKDPTDCSSFDALPPMSSSWMSDQDKYMDAKYDSMWKKEFGEV
jgi:serine/threonine protein kinase